METSSEPNPWDQFPIRFAAVEEGPGRPKRANVDILRTQVWVFIVMERSGWTLYRLEREFHPEQIKRSDGKLIRPRRWDRYREGKMAMKDLPGEDNLIDRVEARFPGTGQWFRHPIWKALSDQSMKKELIIKGLKELEPDVRRWVLTNRHPDGTHRSPRVPPFPEETQRRLIRRGSFDALGAAVLMVRYSEVIGHPDLRHPALNVYYALQPTLSRHRYLQHVYPRLFSLVDFYCRRWIFFEKDPAQRVEAIITWQGLQKNVWNVPKRECTESDQPPSGQG